MGHSNPGAHGSTSQEFACDPGGGAAQQTGLKSGLAGAGESILGCRMQISLPFRFSTGAALILAAWLLAGCGVSDPQSPKFVLAQGKGVKVTRGELDSARSRFLESRRLDASQVPKEQLGMLEEKLLRDLVIHSLLIREAASVRLPDLDAKVEAQIQKIQTQCGGEKGLQERLKETGSTIENLRQELLDQFRIQQLVDTKVPAPAEPPEAAVQKIYNENKPRFASPPAIRVSHILIQVPPGATPAVEAQKKKLIEAAHARVSKGEDFAKVARAVSEHPSGKAEGGDLGYFSKEQMDPQYQELAAVAFKTKAGSISPVFKTSMGYDFLKVTGNRPETVPGLDKMRPEIVRFIKTQQYQDGFKAYCKKLETDANIVYHLAQAEPARPPLPRPSGTGAATPLKR